MLDDARILQDCGVFSLVLEGIPRALGAKITQELEIPTIGIGAGEKCDGQVIVWQDLLGLGERKPKFVKCWANLNEVMLKAINGYDQSVKDGSFPDLEHSYSIENEEEIVSKLK